MASSRRNFLKGSLGMLAASAQQRNPLARPQRTRNASARANLFPGFKPMRITTSGATINAVVGGSGPPVLMLHGYPQTHVMWHKVAPGLAERFTVVAADLRGYGDRKEKAVDARGRSLRCGHFIAEEVPQETLAELRSFLTAS